MILKNLDDLYNWLSLEVVRKIRKLVDGNYWEIEKPVSSGRFVLLYVRLNDIGRAGKISVKFPTTPDDIFGAFERITKKIREEFKGESGTLEVNNEK